MVFSSDFAIFRGQKPNGMVSTASEQRMDPRDQQLMGLLQNGDDFLKIELLRPAKSYYERALKLDPENKTIEKKIQECNKMLAFERKVMGILVAVAALILLTLLLLK